MNATTLTSVDPYHILSLPTAVVSLSFLCVLGSRDVESYRHRLRYLSMVRSTSCLLEAKSLNFGSTCEYQLCRHLETGSG